MSAVSKSFTAVGLGPEILVRRGESFTYAVSGTFVGTVKVEQEDHGGWTVLASKTTAASDTLTVDSNKPRARIRFRCAAFTSGTIVTSLTSATSEVTSQITDASGAPVLNVTEDGLAVPSGKVLSTVNQNLTTPLGAVCAVEASFTETAGAGTYTGSVAVPAGAAILDILVNGIALWDNAGAVTMKVGDVADDDGYYTAINLKATDLLAGESLSFALAGGKAGVYIANSQVSPRYSATARVVSGIVTTASTGGSAGRTRMTVIYHLPVTADIVAATKV